MLHNSLSFFGRFSARPVGRSSGFSRCCRDAASHARYLAGGCWRDRGPAVLADQVPPDRGSVVALLAHGRLLHDLLPIADNTLKAMRAVPRKSDQDALRSLVLARQTCIADDSTAVSPGTLRDVAASGRVPGSPRAAAAQRELGAAAACRAGARDRGHLDALHQRAIAKYRYGDRTGACRLWDGVDRLETEPILCRSGPSPCRMSGAERGGAFRRVGRRGRRLLRPGSIPSSTESSGFPASTGCRQAKTRAHALPMGLGGWACATNASPDGDSFAPLGLDAVGRPCRISAPNELSLLRMAIDPSSMRSGVNHGKGKGTAGDAIEQARRMEAVGTYHQRYCPQLQQYPGRNSRPFRGVGRSPRFGRPTMPQSSMRCAAAAERARDLVDQILVFGRRREAQRRPVRRAGPGCRSEVTVEGVAAAGIELSIREPSASLPSSPANRNNCSR